MIEFLDLQGGGIQTKGSQEAGRAKARQALEKDYQVIDTEALEIEYQSVDILTCLVRRYIKEDGFK